MKVEHLSRAAAPSLEGLTARTVAASRVEFLIRVVIITCVVAVGAVLWTLTSLFLLAFTSVLVAILLRAIAERVASLAHLPPPWALALTVIVVIALLVAISILFGATVTDQFGVLAQELPTSLRALEAQLGLPLGVSRLVRESISSFAGLDAVTRVAAVATNAAGSILVSFAAGIYLAAQPTLYYRGLLGLFPRGVRQRVRSLANKTGTLLRHWIVGQVVIMMVVGALTGLGALLIGLPSWVALGIIAGLLEFVPYLGPIVTAIPAVLLAWPGGQDTVLWTLLMLVAVQQFEGLVLTPLVQRQAVSLPPALTLFALFGMGMIFGVAGVLLATPLTILLYVGVQEIYLPTVVHRGSAVARKGPCSSERSKVRKPRRGPA